MGDGLAPDPNNNPFLRDRLAIDRAADRAVVGRPLTVNEALSFDGPSAFSFTVYQGPGAVFLEPPHNHYADNSGSRTTRSQVRGGSRLQILARDTASEWYTQPSHLPEYFIDSPPVNTVLGVAGQQTNSSVYSTTGTPIPVGQPIPYEDWRLPMEIEYLNRFNSQQY